MNLSGFAESVGLREILVASGAYLASAFTLAVAVLRLSPRGWLGRQFRKYLWLIPFSPLIIVIGFVGFLLTIVGLGLRFVGNGFRALFEKATGQQTYRRQRLDATYYKSSETEAKD